MDYGKKYNYDNVIPAAFMTESSNYNRVSTTTPIEASTPPPLNIDKGGFDAQGVTDDLKISAQTASFMRGSLGQNSNMFSQITSNNKIGTTAFTLDNKDVYENLYSGVGVSRFPNVRNLATDEDRLAVGQTTGERWSHGLTKASQNFTKVFIQNTAGAVYGLGSAIANGQIDKLYDNDFTDALDDWNTRSRYSFANFRTEEEKQKSFFKKMGTANFWADDFAQGLSFTLGTLASELAWGALTGGGGIFASSFASGANTLSKFGRVGEMAGSVFRTASGVTRVAEEAGSLARIGSGVVRAENAVAQTAKINNYASKMKNFMSMNALSKVKDGSNIIRSIYTSAAMEGGMEAKQTYRDSYDSFIQSYINTTGKTPDVDTVLEFDNKARNAANLVFAANIPVVAMSNFAQFGSLFGVNFGVTKALGKFTGFNRFVGLEARVGLGKLAETAGEQAFKVSRLGKVTGWLAPKAGAMLTEGVWEEGTQGILSTSAKEWVKSRYNADKTFDNLSMMDSLYKGMQHQYGTKEGREEMYIGALIGAFGGNIASMLQTRSLASINPVNNQIALQRNANIKAWDTLRNEKITIGEKVVEEHFSKVFNNMLNNVMLKNQQDYNEDKANEALAKGDVMSANMFKLNSEFAKYYRTFNGLEDNVDFSIDDLMIAQVNEMDESIIAKQHGISIEEARQAKEDYKLNLSEQLDNFRKASRTAKSTINLMGKTGESVQYLEPFLTNQLYNAQGISSSMNQIASKIGDLWKSNDNYFASKYRLITDLENEQQKDLSDYLKAAKELKDAQDELVKLNNQLPSLSDTKLDENGNRVIVDEKIKHLDKIQELTAKMQELENNSNDKLQRLNTLKSLHNKSKLGGLFENSDFTDLTHQDIQDGFKMLEDLDVYKKELLNNKHTKQQGEYLHNLLEAYGQGFSAMQNINTLYDELSNKNNKNTASFILRLKGGEQVEEFKETKEEKERLDNIINNIQDDLLRDKKISDKTEARSVIRAILRAGQRMTNSRFDRSKDLVRIYDYKNKKFVNEESRLSNINEPVQNEAWASYVKEGLKIDNKTNPKLEEHVQEIIRKQARQIPLSRREQVIYNENEDFFNEEISSFRKNPTDDVITFESILDDIIQRKERSKMPTREEFMTSTDVVNPEVDFLNEKIARKLNNLSNFFQSGFDVPSVLEKVRSFSEEDVSRYIDLLGKGVLIEEEQKELNELENKLRTISEFQGTSTEDNSNLLNDIQQLAQLLDFEKSGTYNKQSNKVDNSEVAESTTTFENSLRTSDGRDLSVAQNYTKAFVTRKQYGDQNVIEISNISPASFVANTDAVMTDTDGKPVTIVNLENRDFINQTYYLHFPDGSIVPFTINKNGNLVFDDNNDDFKNLKEKTGYLFESISSFTKAQPLLFSQNGEVIYVDSDFVNTDVYTDSKGKVKTVHNIIDQDAINELKPDDELIVVYPINNTYNKTLKKGKEMYQEGVLMLFDKKGRFVGVTKRVGLDTDSTGNNKSIYYNFRKQAVDNASTSTTFVNEEQGLKDTGLRVSVDLIWHGHPNFKITVDSDNNTNVEEIDFNDESVSKVSDIGYVNGNNIYSKNDTELDLRNQYYMNTVLKNNKGKNVPFIVIKKNGRNVMYPVSMKVLESNPTESLDNILNDDSLTNGEKVLQLNKLLNDFNVPYTSLFFNNTSLNDENFIETVKERLVNSDLYANVENWLDDRSIAETLQDEATINIDLNENAFHSPKIKFNIPITENNKDKSNAKKINSEKDFLKRKQEIENKMKELPNNGVVNTGGLISTSIEYDTLKAQLDDLISKYEQFLKNEENKKRGSKQVQEDAEKESEINCPS